MQILAILLVAITSFIATNIDDIIVLVLLFSQLNSRFRLQHIIAGQYIGFTALILASLPGLFGSLIIPQAWIGLLGLVPIAMGVKQLLSQGEEEEQIQLVSDVSTQPKNQKFPASFISNLVSIQTYKVAAIRLANGGDNIGIYVPLFASGNLLNFGITLSVFYFLVGVWCVIAYLLTRHPALAKLIARYGHKVVPFVLIGLGIFILFDSETYQLLPLFQ
ncbi:cadmium resistance transporter [Pleurocapsales cyanobacterium LEGE 06147]|nr:cadmium resistance transporter [Pleurocapsales cyanobacterium LEGE 06147]